MTFFGNIYTMKENTKSFELEINKSRFIAYRLELNSLEQVKPFLEMLRKEHKKASLLFAQYDYFI